MKTMSRFSAALPLMIGTGLLIEAGCGDRNAAPPAALSGPQPPARAPAARTIHWQGLDTKYRGATEIGNDDKVRRQR
jgi:hypothetical protein